MFSVKLIVFLTTVACVRSFGVFRDPPGDCVGECPTVYEPLCASDGKTYVNQCYLTNALCSEPTLYQKHAGECASVRARGIICTTPWCWPVHEPVCGSDGRTYENVCELNNAMCDNEHLKVQHRGPCTPTF
ncbi:four-domain proteases inhibitor-like [Dreissena polymorpha]|uniref:Kazal-like domain-containing protein n=1 Tax=Dreissena polymorpha TaxID=45954 RepID=A0A9D4M4B4_DREPO|nr:four-domain proteases inhibitor-like [Dreissena polymorpha]KAH3869346.1 hypothetical protein DPMN_032509 [Dreissena polymorpha]